MRIKRLVEKRLRRTPDPWAPDRRIQIVHCAHHKVGTVWFAKALRAVAEEFGLTFSGQGVTDLSGADIVMFRHSRNFDPALFGGRPYSGSHMIRDPRDVVISGYFYHLWTDEAWVHKPKAAFGGRSYQDHLNSLDQDEGLLAEIERVSHDAVRDMAAWSYDQPQFLELRYEDVIGHERETFERLFLHHGFIPPAAERASAVCDRFSFTKLTERSPGQVEERSHRRSGKPGQWRDLFGPEHEELFEQLNPGLVERLGYSWS